MAKLSVLIPIKPGLKKLNNRLIPVLTVMLLVVVGTEVFLLGNPLSHEKPNLSNNEFATQIIQKCANSSYKPSCYDKEIPNLMLKPVEMSMENAFAVTQIIQSRDKSYAFCHVLGHELAAKEVDRNPNKWKDVIARCPSGVCSNGCVHGAFQQRFRAVSLSGQQIQEVKQDLKTICEKRDGFNPTGIEQGSCYHALGHMAMYMTNANLKNSLLLCDEMAKKSDGRDFSHICYDGAFMQIYQPLEAEDRALIKGQEQTATTVASFCGSFTGSKKASCLSESWPLFTSEIMQPDGLVKFCTQFEGGEQTRCYEGLFDVLAVQYNFDQNKLSDFCSGLPQSEQGHCFGTIASRFIETDYSNILSAIDFCKMGDKVNASDACFQSLINYSGYNFHIGSAAYKEFCNDLPDSYKSQCTNHS